MIRLVIAPIVLLFFFSTAVGQEKGPKPKDNWQRMKECTEQVERIAKRYRWAEMKQEGGVTLLSWQSHYSPKYERCYVLVSYMNNETGTGLKNQGMPLFSYEFFDAFEGKELASCSDDPFVSDIFCLKGEGTSVRHWSCEACREFVQDRMNN